MSHWHLGFIQLLNRNRETLIVWQANLREDQYKVWYVRVIEYWNLLYSKYLHKQEPILCGQVLINGSALMSRLGFFVIISLILRNSYYWSVWKQFVFLRLITPCKAYLIRFVNSFSSMKGKVKPISHLGIIKCFKGKRSKFN